jgi:hypothetical protein
MWRIVEDMSKETRRRGRYDMLHACYGFINFRKSRPPLAAEHMKTSASYTDALEKIFPLAGINRFISLIPSPHSRPLLVLLIVRPSRGQ